MIAKKVCNRCGEKYPETRDFFGQYKNNSGGTTRIGFRNTCRKCMAAHTRNYDAKNPDNAAERIARRQIRSETVSGCMPNDLPELRKALGDRCRFCNKDLRASGHIDHLTPLSRGGTHSISNLTLSCEACNLAKTSKTLDEFILWRVERGLPFRKILIAEEKPDPIKRVQLRERYK